MVAHYKTYQPVFEPISIYRIMDNVRNHGKTISPTSDLSINIPENLPLIKGDSHLYVAISHIIFTEPQIRMRPSSKPFLPRITIYQNTDNTLTINLWTDLEIEQGKFKIDGTAIFSPGGYLATAKAIIEHLFSELHVQSVTEGNEFEFTVPLWEGS